MYHKTQKSLNPKASQCSQNGMSLVETLVAIVLFSIGTLAVLSMTTGSFQINDHSRSVDEATNLARTTLERLLSIPYDDVLLSDNTADGLTGLTDSDVTSADYHSGNAGAAAFVAGFYSGSRYRFFWNVANNLPVNGSKSISVVVTWQGTLGSKRVNFQTIRAE
ncbi:MAG: prepilin-type N-terminal cleavage/methylation domain-containing protein [Desulfuromonadales bacterium]|nr:prepilin-type N-terminal cleavage/methylation domain-containing protein [Desulfuromonadales bacterium]